jgi:hypothetical protein
VDRTHHRIYYVGIIDVLTRYTAKKMAAHTAKGIKHGVCGEGFILMSARHSSSPNRHCREKRRFPR